MKNEHDGDITPGTNSYYGDLETPVSQPVVKKHSWGSQGTRYDEACVRCGNETEIDNNTELCEKCGK